jgi:hypothetical protein
MYLADQRQVILIDYQVLCKMEGQRSLALRSTSGRGLKSDACSSAAGSNMDVEQNIVDRHMYFSMQTEKMDASWESSVEVREKVEGRR